MKSRKKKVGRFAVTVLTSALALTLVAGTLAGCDAILGTSSANTNTTSSAYTGIWKASKAELLGLEVGIAEVISTSFEVELKTGGNCEIRTAGQVIACKWEENSNTVTISGGAIADIVSGGSSPKLSLTMQNDMLVLENFSGLGEKIKFAKQ